MVVDALKAAYPLLRWDQVAAGLDHEGFNIPDEAATALLLGIWQRATGSAFPAAVLVGRRWHNTLGQLSFLRHAVGAPPHVVSWEGTRQLVRTVGLALTGLATLLGLCCTPACSPARDIEPCPVVLPSQLQPALLL